MANFFDAWRQEQFGDAAGPGHGAVDFEADTIKAFLVDTGTTDPALATHQDFADLSTAADAVQTNHETALTSKTLVISGNVITFDAADTTLSSLAGNSAEELCLFKVAGGAETADLLICQWDEADVTGLAFTPNGGDANIAWNASGIWAI